MESAIEKYPRKNGILIQYGTAGFRTIAKNLDHVVLRMGVLAALRSRAKGSAAIGLMITASHNPEPDNGVKLVDPHGEMLEMDWEIFATRLANSPDSEFQNELAQIAAKQSIDVNKPALVYIGRDTRSSSKRLADIAAEGVRAFNGTPFDHGLVTTPMLHYFVFAHNMGYSCEGNFENSYFIKLASSFKDLNTENSKSNYDPVLDFDGANGVGAPAMERLLHLLDGKLQITLHNTDIVNYEKLNYECGADYVKTNMKVPTGFQVTPNRRIVSFDGDADRVIYSYLDSNNEFHLLDGDRMATLVAGYFMDLVKLTGLNLSLGLVQTAYANGNSTKYITETMKIPVACVPTGVKHLHHKALDFDIGVYFEANGHGTVVFSNNARNLVVQVVEDDKLDVAKKQSTLRLQQLMNLINSTVGDAISDMLLVETILQARGWSIQDWETAYTDLPSRLMKISVQDRNAIETYDADRKCSKPVGLQEEIDRAVADFPNGRSFVRPSGTEDVVRVYAEAETQIQADQLGLKVAQIVHKIAGGIGPIPS